MSHKEDRHLDFVLKHYKEGTFDTRKAVERFKSAQGISTEAPSLFQRFVTYGGLAIAASIMLGVFLFMYHSSSQWTEITADAAQETFLLPDSTCVTLTKGSSMSYRMKEGSRTIKMEGKAYFDVARDEGRPFEVDADGAFVRVLGTEFMVDATGKRNGHEATVYVAEGKVLFARNPKAEGVILTEGMGAELMEDEEIPQIQDHADANQIAWQRGTFIFDQTPLKEVLDCLSRHYGVSFAATDLSKKLSGEFYTDDLDLIIELIESALDVTVIKK